MSVPDRTAEPGGAVMSADAHHRAPGCPVAAGFDPFDPGFLADPHPELARMREGAPIWYSPVLDRWVVTRYEEIDRILTDPATFSAAEAQRPVHPACPEAAEILSTLRLVPTMSNCDPPEHRRYRSVMSRAMSPRRIARLRPTVEKRAIELLDRFAPRLHGDLVRELFYRLPALTVFALIGFPADDSDRIKAWCADKLEVNWGRPTVDQQVRSARGMIDYFGCSLALPSEWDADLALAARPAPTPKQPREERSSSPAGE